MNNTIPRPLLYLIVGLFIFAASIIIASPLFDEQTKVTTNESTYGDCIVQDVKLIYGFKNDADDFELYETKMNCESGNRSITVSIDNEEPDQITILIHLDRDFENFNPVRKPNIAPSLVGYLTTDESYFESEELRQEFVNGESDFRFKDFKEVNVKISSKEQYKPEDILNDLAENGELKLEFEINAHTHEKTVKFDGVSKAIKEFFRRVKSLQETNNKDR